MCPPEPILTLYIPSYSLVDEPPSAAVRALEQRFSEGGITTTLGDDSQIVRVINLVETYRVRPSKIPD